MDPAHSGSTKARATPAVQGRAIRATRAARVALSRVMISRTPPRTQPAATENRITTMAKTSYPVTVETCSPMPRPPFNPVILGLVPRIHTPGDAGWSPVSTEFMDPRHKGEDDEP